MSGLNLKAAEPAKTDEPKADESQPAAAVSNEPAARWSSHPIQRYCVDKFQFEKGVLIHATAEEAAEFQALYDGLPLSEQSRLKKIDLAAAEDMVRKMLGMEGAATKEIDSSVGDRQPKTPVGVGDLLNQN